LLIFELESQSTFFLLLL